LSVPDVVKVKLGLLRVLNTCGVTAGDEVRDAAVHSGAGMPQHFRGTAVVHGRWPHCENGVLGVQGAVVEQGLMLMHASLRGDVIILAPATKWVKKEDWVLEALFE